MRSLAQRREERAGRPRSQALNPIILFSQLAAKQLDALASLPLFVWKHALGEIEKLLVILQGLGPVLEVVVTSSQDEIKSRRRLRLLKQRFDQGDSLGILLLHVKAGGQPFGRLTVVSIELQAGAKLGLGIFLLVEQRLAKSAM